MNAAATFTAKIPVSIDSLPSPLCIIDGRYEARLARNENEIEEALRLRYRVFNVELGGAENSAALETDAYDALCDHLIVIDRDSGAVVGTYRLNSKGSAAGAEKYYSFAEFGIEELPGEVLNDAVEVGRACIAAEHRNTKVLYLLWKCLARYMRLTGRRYIFGCCSIFTDDPLVGERAFHQLARAGHFHDQLRVEPRRSALYLGPVEAVESAPVELPGLFNMYLRIGAKVCGPPITDEDFGTIDFFVVFDRHTMTEKCRKTFFDGVG